MVSHESEANSSPITIQNASLLSYSQMFAHTHILAQIHMHAHICIQTVQETKINQDEQSLSERAVAH